MTAETYPASCRHFHIKQSDTAGRARMAVQGRCTIFGFPITGFLHFFCNFAVPFTKSGQQMTVTDTAINATIAYVQNYAFKENWKSTAGYDQSLI